MGSSVSLPTSLTSFSVISAKASAADLCRSTLSEKDKVERERSGSPVKKLVSDRSVVEGREDGQPTSSRYYISASVSPGLTLEVLKQIGNCIAFIVEEQWLVGGIPGATTA